MQQQDPTQTMEALKRLAPIVGATAVVVTSFFTLQSQISEIKLRSDLTNTQLFGTLLEVKSDIKDLKAGQERARQERADTAAKQREKDIEDSENGRR